MLESKAFSHSRNLVSDLNTLPITNQRKQQRRMATALMLLVFTLVLVLFHDRDFWFPEEVRVQDDTQQASLAATATNVRQKHPASKAHTRDRIRPEGIVDSAESADRGPSVAATAIVLPPQEVEVIAADSHRKLRLGSNIVQVNLERASSPSRAKPNVLVHTNPSGPR